jgi:hypothetical protein
MESAPENRPKKKRGPVARLGPVVQTHVYIPEDLFAWAKHQKEGFSALMRRLLAEEYERQTKQPEHP